MLVPTALRMLGLGALAYGTVAGWAVDALGSGTAGVGAWACLAAGGVGFVVAFVAAARMDGEG